MTRSGKSSRRAGGPPNSVADVSATFWGRTFQETQGPQADQHWYARSIVGHPAMACQMEALPDWRLPWPGPHRLHLVIGLLMLSRMGKIPSSIRNNVPATERLSSNSTNLGDRGWFFLGGFGSPVFSNGLGRLEKLPLSGQWCLLDLRGGGGGFLTLAAWSFVLQSAAASPPPSQCPKIRYVVTPPDPIPQQPTESNRRRIFPLPLQDARRPILYFSPFPQLYFSLSLVTAHDATRHIYHTFSRRALRAPSPLTDLHTARSCFQRSFALRAPKGPRKGRIFHTTQICSESEFGCASAFFLLSSMTSSRK